MIVGVLIAAASLAIGMPAVCEPPPDQWRVGVAAIYHPGEFRTSVYGPWCAEVRDGTPMGARVLAHELAHAYQDAMGLPFDEGQADRLAAQWWRSLQRALGGRPSVRLAP